MHACGHDVHMTCLLGTARVLAELRDQWRASTGVALDELSMGMSHDFEVAIEEGATIVRVGTGIFGERARPAEGAEAE